LVKWDSDNMGFRSVPELHSSWGSVNIGYGSSPMLVAEYGGDRHLAPPGITGDAMRGEGRVFKVIKVYKDGSALATDLKKRDIIEMLLDQLPSDY
jgi:hypothetical protein